MNPAPDSPYAVPPRNPGHLQWKAALGAALFAGLVLMIVPRASPWSSLTFFAPVIMGRVVPEDLGVPLIISKALHLGLALLYGLIISLAVTRIAQLWAIFAGALYGLALYLANFGITSALVPHLAGDEITVAFSHVVFGGITAGAYRGLLQRKTGSIREDGQAA